MKSYVSTAFLVESHDSYRLRICLTFKDTLYCSLLLKRQQLKTLISIQKTLLKINLLLQCVAIGCQNYFKLEAKPEPNTWKAKCKGFKEVQDHLNGQPKQLKTLNRPVFVNNRNDVWFKYYSVVFYQSCLPHNPGSVLCWAYSLGVAPCNTFWFSYCCQWKWVFMA